ncbi:hypothetical protein B0H13DRAFT_1992396 [Mycena leptocephala]|nr:hypothetical protein B0H13DRAFT_1992396 [Mycena leptocephala]
MLQSSALKGSRTTRNNHNTSALPRQIPFPYSGTPCRRHNTKGLARPVSRMLRRAGPAPKNSPGQQSWYQPKRPRSNAGSATGRSAAGSATGRSTTGRHTRQASLDSRLSAKNQKLAAEYGTDLGAIREDARSVRSGKGYGEGSQRARSMRAPSTESLVPPPLPEKDARHRKQLIADELRYSDPDLAESWRRDAAANADTSSSKSRPPRNVRVPANLRFPSPLSPPTGPVSLGHMRARTMSGSTGKSGWTQPPNPVDLVSRPSLRRVKERRPISPSDLGSPEFGTIRVEPPSQSSSQVPLVNATPHMDRYLSPNYQMQPLGQPLGQPQAGSGFVPQSVTIPAQITVPVTFKGKAVSSPVQASIPFPAESGEADYSQFRPPSGYGGSTTSLSRARDASAASFNAEERPLSRVRSTSALSRKSGKSGKTEYAGPTLTPGHGLQRQASNTSLRSTGSAYARFDAKSYVDPAYFAADTSAGPIPVPAPRSRRGSASSRHSGLSYIGPP